MSYNNSDSKAYFIYIIDIRDINIIFLYYILKL